MRRLYIIAGCNGAGKTTASYTILPEILNCKEFVNADEIARGLSPFNPDESAIQAGKLMLNRINTLLNAGESFAIETTLSTKSYVSLVKKAQEQNFVVTLLFFWLNSPELAVKRVAIRVKEGGHNIPEDVIRRRYERGLFNFFNKFRFKVDSWLFYNNSKDEFLQIAEGRKSVEYIHENIVWNSLIKKYYEK